ncbi:tRNA-specific adenosine deaminase [Acidihalobacter aeolianus]|uniref:tRNA-specific adenosine deaminase n=1 Tax=Acidihalobacter aeolianus TaxID=2792603 RepID=A0A1D8K4L3_9GAMM|nr:nucleoside deaminase [Acidihalobacter aeolianus]AOV15901.1 tRNA-specific adenosine deaminase [Acidihalobacter aeolianus]
MPDNTDLRLLRRAIHLAAQSRERGDHPFGALLADAEGHILLEAMNASGTLGDRTAHAERTLMIEAARHYTPDFLAGCTLYSSAEPCAMCAGTAYWAGIGRVVYGLGERHLKALIGPHPDNLTLDLPCRTVFAAGQRSVAVLGPLLEDEAENSHLGFWDTAGNEH